ncbi:MAG: hypothetical protein ACLFTR_05800 [Candidatus Woesearchaeota archaeon]
MFTIAWQLDTGDFNDIKLCIICVNENKDMREMPSMTLRYCTDHSRAAIKLVQWMESLVRKFPDKRFQLVGDKKNPSFNQLVKERMSYRGLELPIVDLKNLYISSGAYEQEVTAEIKELHDWNEHLEDKRRAFYRALEAIKLQEIIRKSSHNIDRVKG